MNFFSRSKLAPEVTDDGKRNVTDPCKANVIGNGAFQYNRKIVVRRISLRRSRVQPRYRIGSEDVISENVMWMLGGK
jgi:hypothetical protein